MTMQLEKGETYHSAFRKVMNSDTPDIDKLREMFELITGHIVENAEKEIELRKAMQDKEAVIKEQIKMAAMKHVRGIFQECYKRVREGG